MKVRIVLVNHGRKSALVPSSRLEGPEVRGSAENVELELLVRGAASLKESLETLRSVDESLDVHEELVHHLEELDGRVVGRRRREPIQGLFHRCKRRVGFLAKSG